jgi:hypothetical protein
MYLDEFELKIVSGANIIGRLLIKRGFSPRVFSALSSSPPKIGAVGIGDTYVYLSMGLKIGVERVLTEASAGDVGYSPRFQGLVFFIADSPDCRFLNTAPVGKLIPPWDGIKNLREGDVVSVIRV